MGVTSTGFPFLGTGHPDKVLFPCVPGLFVISIVVLFTYLTAVS